MNEQATATPAPRRSDRRFAGGLPWTPVSGPGRFASTAPVVLPERAKPRPTPTPADLEELGRRTASVAHDFNNLLSVIIVCAGEIASGATDVHRDRAEEIIAAARRGAELSRGLLAAERAVADAAPEPAPTPLAVDAAVRRSLRLIERALGPAVAVDLRSEAALPPVGLAEGDLERVLLNLAANAGDAMPAGGSVAIAIETIAIAPGDLRLGTGLHVRIGFADTGIGMSPEVARRALEPRFSTKDRQGGSGLGLAGAHALVRGAGGDLRINSRPGAGTAVSIYLPALDAAGQPLALAGSGS